MTISLGLNRIHQLLQHLSSPHLKVPIIHVAGTNGKGSICAYLDSILTQAGLSTGRFNSPHLITVNDSILIKNKPIPMELYAEHKAKVESVNREHRIEATPFELLTATAFQAFAESTTIPLDCAIVETGMGGRDDATNVVPDPLLTILTAIDLDHQAFLGDTIEEIATIKAGIIKRNTACIVAPQAHREVIPIIERIAAEHSASVHIATTAQTSRSNSRKAIFSFPTSTHSSLSSHQAHITAQIPLEGAYQLSNAATAVLAAYLLHALPCCRKRVPQLTLINTNSIVDGIELTCWPGRLHWLTLFTSLDATHPSANNSVMDGKRKKIQILVDGAHNTSSAVALHEYLQTLLLSEGEEKRRKLVLIFACSAPRNPADVLRHLLKDNEDATVIATEFSTPVEGMPWVSSVEKEKIVDAAKQCSIAEDRCLIAKDAKEAVQLARGLLDEDEDRLVVAAGSLYLAADMMRLQNG